MRAKQREIFTNIPEFYVKDMCSWFSYVAIHKPCALKGLDVSDYSNETSLVVLSHGTICLVTCV